jgi:aldose sugar dehydrogenase
MHQFSRNSVLTLNNHKKVVALALLMLFLGGTGATGMFYSAFGQEEFRQREFVEEESLPTLVDTKLKVEEVVGGLDTPTTMAFLGPNDFLILEKDKGTVLRVTDGKVSDQPLLDVNVANSVERCMCGIAISKHGSTTYVFLYYTEIDGADGDDRNGKQPIGNRLYRYELAGDKLVKPLLLLDLPAYPGPRHNGGAIEIGPDNNIYVPIGDVDGSFRGEDTETKAQNYVDGKDVDGRSGILRITQDGQPVGDGILGDSVPLKLYYAYGIRNSFGLGFDPVTGNLWETENGPGERDEINLVTPGFNSGWQRVHGLTETQEDFNDQELTSFGDKGHYEEPKLVWENTAGPTAVTFMTSDKLGAEYKNDMFVGDVHNGRIYHFKLNSERTDLVLPEALGGNVVKKPTSPGIKGLIFGENFAGVTDLTVGPDGYLYVVSIGQGKVFRILEIV